MNLKFLLAKEALKKKNKNLNLIAEIKRKLKLIGFMQNPAPCDLISRKRIFLYISADRCVKYACILYLLRNWFNKIFFFSFFLSQTRVTIETNLFSFHELKIITDDICVYSKRKENTKYKKKIAVW